MKGALGIIVVLLLMFVLVWLSVLFITWLNRTTISYKKRKREAKQKKGE